MKIKQEKILVDVIGQMDIEKESKIGKDNTTIQVQQLEEQIRSLTIHIKEERKQENNKKLEQLGENEQLNQPNIYLGRS